MSAITTVSGEELIEELKNHFSPGEVGLVRQAYEFAKSHYASFKHPTGRPYLDYVLGVAMLLADIDSLPLVIAS